MDANVIETIIQGGSVGVAVLVIIVGWRLGAGLTTLITNHFVHFCELLAGISAKTDETNSKLDRLCDLVSRNKD